jgi:hypothetical protein
MYLFLTVPFIIQGITIILDEYLFHRKRGLPRWERIGHPLDTLTVLICFSWILFVPFTVSVLKVYLFLALFSCLFVTKDEFVHKECCPASEQWLHSVLFINHPVLLTAAGLMWPLLHGNQPPYWMLKWFNQPEFFATFLQLQAAFVALFMTYQAVYWNFIWKEPRERVDDQ